MRKKGKRINQGLATLPLGVKRNGYELSARAAMLAITRGIYEEQNIVDLWGLADLCERLNKEEQFISSHAKSVKNLAAELISGNSQSMVKIGIVSSADVLIKWLHKQDNNKMAEIAIEQIKQLGKK